MSRFPSSMAAVGSYKETLEGHEEWALALAFSLDGNILASGSKDSTIKLWDITTGELLNTLETHSDSVRSLAFAADGNKLVSGSEDGTIKIWRVPARERAWNNFVSDYHAGKAWLPELELLRSIYPGL